MLDDDYMSMLGLKEHLEEAFNCKVVLSASENILHRLRHERFDLIVIDSMIHLTSPDESGKEAVNIHYEEVNWRKTGLEFLKRLKRGEYTSFDGNGTLPDVPVFILSAVANNSVKKELIEIHQEIDYHEKPFRLHELVDRFRKYLE